MEVIIHNTFEPFPLEDNSVQAVITSPPYWGLRKYDIPDIIIGGRKDCNHEWFEIDSSKGNGDGKSFRRDKKASFKKNDAISGECLKCGAWKGQYGLEPTFQQYIKNTLVWCEEIYRVLKDDGVFFLNIGDTYISSGGASRHKGYNDPKYKEGRSGAYDEPAAFKQSIKPKSKAFIPHRAAIALIDEVGFICRNDIIWQKPNAMPESCQDRLSKKYENIFMFSKNQKYHFDLDAIKIKWDESSVARAYRGASGESKYSNTDNGQTSNSREQKRENKTEEFKNLSEEEKERYKNPGDIWKIPTQPSSFSHYAMWPEKLVKRMIECSTRPGDLILDPFAGSGTTLKVAEQLGRRSIGFDLGYENIREKRLTNIQKELIV